MNFTHKEKTLLKWLLCDTGLSGAFDYENNNDKEFLSAYGLTKKETEAIAAELRGKIAGNHPLMENSSKVQSSKSAAQKCIAKWEKLIAKKEASIKRWGDFGGRDISIIKTAKEALADIRRLTKTTAPEAKDEIFTNPNGNNVAW